MSATHFIVPARTSGAPRLQQGSPCSSWPRTPQPHRPLLVDSRGYADLFLDNVAVGVDAVLGAVDGAFPVLDAILDRPGQDCAPK